MHHHRGGRQARRAVPGWVSGLVLPGPGSTGALAALAPAAAGVAGPYALAALAVARAALGLSEAAAGRLRQACAGCWDEAHQQAAERAYRLAVASGRRGRGPDLLDAVGVVSGAAADAAVAVLVADLVPAAELELLAGAWRACGLPLHVPAPAPAAAGRARLPGSPALVARRRWAAPVRWPWRRRRLGVRGGGGARPVAGGAAVREAGTPAGPSWRAGSATAGGRS